MGTLVKEKVGELEDKVRERFSRRLRKELTVSVQGLSRERRFLARFQDGCDKYLTSNQLTIMTVQKIPMTE